MKSTRARIGKRSGQLAIGQANAGEDAEDGAEQDGGGGNLNRQQQALRRAPAGDPEFVEEMFHHRLRLRISGSGVRAAAARGDQQAGGEIEHAGRAQTSTTRKVSMLILRA